jgi:hypothetical protein
MRNHINIRLMILCMESKFKGWKGKIQLSNLYFRMIVLIIPNKIRERLRSLILFGNFQEVTISRVVRDVPRSGHRELQITLRL